MRSDSTKLKNDENAMSMIEESMDLSQTQDEIHFRGLWVWNDPGSNHANHESFVRWCVRCSFGPGFHADDGSTDGT